MSDDAIRTAERTYRASGAPQDGEAWVQVVLRSTGLNSTFLIARVIETQRALAAMAMMSRTATYEGVRDPIVEAMQRPVTPDDMVSFLRGGRDWLVQAQVDPNAHLPHTRGVPRGDAILCNHANENPGHCPCDPDCYCRQDGHTCSDVSSEPSPFDRECDLCSNEATWRFRGATVVHVDGNRNGYRIEVVCSRHLPIVRRQRDGALTDMVRHHEAVDDV